MSKQDMLTCAACHYTAPAEFFSTLKLSNGVKVHYCSKCNKSLAQDIFSALFASKHN